MSRHTCHLDDSQYKIVLGVDRPLNHVFATVYEGRSEAKGFNPFSWFEPNEQGVDKAIQAVENFVGTGLPVSIKVTLLDDLRKMKCGLDINYEQDHTIRCGDAFVC